MSGELSPDKVSKQLIYYACMHAYTLIHTYTKKLIMLGSMLPLVPPP